MVPVTARGEQSIATTGCSERFNLFLDQLSAGPNTASARVSWLAGLFATHRNTPRGWLLEDKVPHKLEEMVLRLIEQYAEQDMDATRWAEWIKWGGIQPSLPMLVAPDMDNINHDLKRDLYLTVDKVARQKGLEVESFPKHMRWQIYDLVIMYAEAEGGTEINEKFVEGLLELVKHQ